MIKEHIIVQRVSDVINTTSKRQIVMMETYELFYFIYAFSKTWTNFQRSNANF